MGKSKKSRLADTAPGQPKVVCFFCEGEFADEGILIQHQQAKHFKCTECSRFAGGRCPTHGCKHKCLVTLSCHWKKDHKGELKTIPGAKEGRDDPKKFWPVYGIHGTPEDFVAERSMSAPIPADVAPPIPESELPPIPDQPPLPPMRLPDVFAEWTMPAPIPDQLPMAPLPGLQGDGAIGGVKNAEGLPPSNGSEVYDFAGQVQAWMAVKEAADEEIERSQEQAPPISFLTSSASFPISSASSSSLAFKSDSPATRETKPSSSNLIFIRTLPSSSLETKQREPSGRETMPRSQEWRSRSMDRQDRDRRSRSRDRSDRATHTGRGSRSRDRQKSGATFHERERQEDRMRDDRGRRRSPDRGRDGNAGRNCAIKITQGHIASRIWLQGLMSPYGRLEYSHTGNRLNPERDPPWVLFATSGSAEDAMKAIGAGTVMDGNGAPIKAEWKTMIEKGKGKGDQKDISSRDLHRRGHGRGLDDRGARDDRR